METRRSKMAKDTPSCDFNHAAGNYSTSLNASGKKTSFTPRNLHGGISVRSSELKDWSKYRNQSSRCVSAGCTSRAKEGDLTKLGLTDDIREIIGNIFVLGNQSVKTSKMSKVQNRF